MPTGKGAAHVGRKAFSLVAGMVAGAERADTGRFGDAPLPDLNPPAGDRAERLVRHVAVPRISATTDPAVLDTVNADKVSSRRAIVEQVHADTKALRAANSAWRVLAVMASNLNRVAATTGTRLFKATTVTILRT